MRDPLRGEMMWVNRFFDCVRGPVFWKTVKNRSVLEIEVELSELCWRPRA